MQVSDIELMYSGGDTNTNPVSSLGGIISTAGSPDDQGFTDPSINGITVAEVGSMVQGTLTFNWDLAAKILTVAMPDSGFGVEVEISSGGDTQYILTGSTGLHRGYVIIDVVAASLTSASGVYTSTVSLTSENIFPNTTPNQAVNGANQYRCIYAINNHATESIEGLRVFLAYNTSGEDEITYAIDTDAGVGDGSTTGVATAITGESDTNNDLLGLVFSNSEDPEAGLYLDAVIAPGECVPIWVGRVTPAHVKEAVVNNDFSLGFRIYVGA